LAYKLKIGNFIEVPIHLRVRDGGQTKDFKFHVTGKRLSAEEARTKLSGEGDVANETVGEFLKANLTDWRGQTLVVDEADQPAAFAPAALEALLGVAGAAGVIYVAYLKELAVSDGSEARRKN